MTNGRQKGAVAEREVAKMMQHWWRALPVEKQETMDDEVCEFFRTPQSGGWGTQHARGTYRVAGDVATTSQSWPFTVEVKRREGWSLTMFAKAGKRGSPVWNWWRQCVAAANEEDAIPMLVMRKNHMPWILLVPDYVGVHMLGSIKADICWPDPQQVAHLNPTPVHPMGFLLTKWMAEADPERALGLAEAPRLVAPG